MHACCSAAEPFYAAENFFLIDCESSMIIEIAGIIIR